MNEYSNRYAMKALKDKRKGMPLPATMRLAGDQRRIIKVMQNYRIML